MKKSKQIALKLQSGQTVLFVQRGVTRPIDDSEAVPRPYMGPDVTHAELDQIVKYATAKRNNSVPEPLEKTDEGHDIEYHDDGDISVGCQEIAYKTLMRGHRLSLAVRRTRSRKS